MAVPKRKRLVLWILSVVVVCSFLYIPGIHGDIPDDVVYTELHKDVRIGERAVLTCRFRGSPLAVYWKKGDDPRSAPNLVSWIPTDDVIGKCERQRPCEVMEMNENRSLVIKEISIEEQGRYICRVANYNGYLIHNFTDVRIFSPPTEPYPVIDGCGNRDSLGSKLLTCHVLINQTVTITCSVTNYYPEIELFFLYGTKQMTTIDQVEQTNVDSTKNKSISIEAGPSGISYTCVASDVPGLGERRTATILVMLDESSTLIPPLTRATMTQRRPGNRAAIIVVPMTVLFVIGALGAFIWWKRLHRNTRNSSKKGSSMCDALSARVTHESIPMIEEPTPGGLNRSVVSEKGKMSVSEEEDISDLQNAFNSPHRKREAEGSVIKTHALVTEQGDFSDVLKTLGLDKCYPSKISLMDSMVIKKSTGDLKLVDLPWEFIQKVLMINFHARDQVLSEVSELSRAEKPDDRGESDFDTLLKMQNTSGHEGNALRLNPLDVLVAIFTCCDNFLKQTLAQKLFVCKIAIPFLYPLGSGGNIGMSLWALRTITVQLQSEQSDISETSVTEKPFPVVTFVRLGRPPLSKSKLANDILRDDSHGTFFHKDCINGTVPRRMTDGLVECSWYIAGGKGREHLPSTTMFLNLRGDASLMNKQVKILQEFSSVMFVTATAKDLARIPNNTIFKQIVHTGTKVILLLISKSTEMRTLKVEFEACDKAVGKDMLKGIPIILSSTRQGIQKNASELKAEARGRLSEEIIGCSCIAMEGCARRAKENGIIIDEYDDEACVQGKVLAEQVVGHMEGIHIVDCKNLLLPLQGPEGIKYWKLRKELHRTRVEVSHLSSRHHADEVKQMGVLREKIVELCKSRLTPFITDFKSTLQMQPDVVMYFLKWINIKLDEKSRANLPVFRRQYHVVRTQFQKKKKKWSAPTNHLLSQVNNAENDLASASLGLENIFREMGQIYEVVNESGNMGYLPEIAAKLLLKGRPLELINGDAPSVPITWVSAVLSKLGNIIGEKKLFVLSALGITGSGKSTLLNTMFGLQFAVSAGRCTRGAYMQLIPVDGDSNLPFDYVVVVNTEGLRAPELQQRMYKHDNELATLVIGLGDVTMINIKGENTAEMIDILQISVLAFLRMGLVGKSFQDHRTCIFVHQNVPSANAEELMIHGSQKLEESLDKMTKEAALSADMEHIHSFSQVINFDAQNHVWYFPDLWHGNPPMAPANPGYSEKVREVRLNLLEEIAKKQATFLTPSELSIRLNYLWNGVLANSPVFSKPPDPFRQSKDNCKLQ